MEGRWKWYFLSIAIIILILVLAIYSGEQKAQANGEEQENNIEIVFGVGIVNGEPKYLDPNYFEVPNVIMALDYINKIDSDIIKAGHLLFLGDSRLLIYDSKKNRPNLRIVKTQREFTYKVENQTLYVSDNGIEWEPVKFKVINDQPHKDNNDPSITIYWVVYLECQWFKGEYEIWSIPNA